MPLKKFSRRPIPDFFIFIKYGVHTNRQRTQYLTPKRDFINKSTTWNITSKVIIV